MAPPTRLLTRAQVARLKQEAGRLAALEARAQAAVAALPELRDQAPSPRDAQGRRVSLYVTKFFELRLLQRREEELLQL